MDEIDGPNPPNQAVVNAQPNVEDEESSEDDEDIEEVAQVGYARNPASVNVDRMLDYKTKKDVAYYEKATKSLYNDTEDYFDASPDGLQSFLRLLKDRASLYHWSTVGHAGVLDIPNEAALRGENGGYDNLLTSYGMISLEHLRAYVSTYIRHVHRPTQDDDMILTCCKGSLTVAGYNKIMLHEKEFTVGHSQSGVLFLKILLRESHIDCNATTTAIRNQMSQASLEEYLQAIGGDIMKFKEHVMDLIQQLQARGERSTDLQTALFYALQTVKDTSFTKHIADKESRWEEGEIPDLTPEKLLVMATTKYKVLVSKDKWQKMTPDQEKIAALESKFEKLRSTKTTKTEKGKSKSNPKDNKNDKNKRPGWLRNNIEPKGNDKKSKTHDGKVWHWCGKSTGGKCTGRWRLHKPSECKGMGQKRPAKDEEKDKEKKKKKKGDPRLEQVMQTIAALKKDAGSDSDSTE